MCYKSFEEKVFEKKETIILKFNSTPQFFIPIRSRGQVLQTFDWVLVSGHDSPRTILKNQLRLCINNDVDVARGFNFSLKVYRATSIYLSKQARFEISIAQLRVLTTIIAIFNS